jgi:DNA-binding SARP family transcriptional activator
MARLALALLGDYRAMLDEKPIAGFESVKVRALLAYLAVEAQHPHRREALAALLWPEQPESDARANLSQALFNLRSILGDRPRRPSLLSVTRETIGLNGACDSWTDVTSFISLLQSCEKHPHAQIETCEACLPRLQEAAALYRGSLLQDLAVHDSVPFEEWVLLKREYLHRLAMEALGWLALGHERRGDYALGLQCARRQIELDPWREEAQRQVMRLLVLSGQRSVALAQYEACRRALAEELGVEPVAETVALYEQIRRGALAQSPHIIMGPIH